MTEEHIAATLTIAVPAARVFAVLADPATHAAIDGTGWVQAPADLAPLAEVGQVFRMDMFHPEHPDGGYQVANEVLVVDPPHAIGWRTGQERPSGRLEFGGWTWRYDLEAVGASQTAVTLTYDWSAVPPSVRSYLDFPVVPPAHLDRSLQHLADLADPASGG